MLLVVPEGLSEGSMGVSVLLELLFQIIDYFVYHLEHVLAVVSEVIVGAVACLAVRSVLDFLDSVKVSSTGKGAGRALLRGRGGFFRGFEFGLDCFCSTFLGSFRFSGLPSRNSAFEVL
jgi:hypothetical protein